MTDLADYTGVQAKSTSPPSYRKLPQHVRITTTEKQYLWLDTDQRKQLISEAVLPDYSED